jgi:YD repeat-containing protein
LGRLLTEQDPLGFITAYGYNAFEQVRTVTDAQGQVTENKTDLASNVVYAVETYRYDAAGNLTRKSLTGSKDKSFLRETVYTYTDANLLHTETGSSGSFARYAYDKNGNLTKRETLREADRYDVETRVRYPGPAGPAEPSGGAGQPGRRCATGRYTGPARRSLSRHDPADHRLCV